MGYEAFARGPEGSSLELGSALFAAARSEGILAELDFVCQIAVLRRARALGLEPPLTVFANLELENLCELSGEQVKELDEASRGLRVIAEVSERDLVGRPAESLQAVENARSRGWGVAIGNVGRLDASLALIPLVSPDVIKLDMSIIQASPSLGTASIAGAMCAEAERSGASVVAEGIETRDHHDYAMALGASLGQGFLLGGPDTQVENRDSMRQLPLHPGLIEPSRRTPFELVSKARPVRRSRKPLLRAISRELELQALAHSEPCLLLATFEHERYFTGMAERYSRMAESLPLVVALGAGMAADPAGDVRGGTLTESDRLISEWVVAVIGPHFSGLLSARDLGDTGPEQDRRFDFGVTYDRGLVAESARTLLARLGAPSLLDAAYQG